MSTTLQAIVGGVTYDLSDVVNYKHLANDGFGLPPQRLLTESGPLQNGVSYLGFRLEPRILALGLFASASTENAYFSKRAEVLNIFKPSNTPIQLRFTKSNGDVRQIDTYYNGGLSLSSTERYNTNQKIAVQLFAPDPIWYDPVAVNVNFGITGGSGGFSIPWAIPWSIGVSTLNQTTTVSYTGTWESFPIVTIYGPITNPVITNTATGDKLDFTGTTVNTGEIYTIDTRYGYKTVTDATGTNQISKLTADSDLTTFRLLAHPEATNGANSIVVTGTNATTVTQVYLTYYNRYIGV
jgi:hypothetical protein